MNTASSRANPSDFLILQNDRLRNRGTLISPDKTGLREIYSFIYLNGQFKAELTVLRMFRPKTDLRMPCTG